MHVESWSWSHSVNHCGSHCTLVGLISNARTYTELDGMTTRAIVQCRLRLMTAIKDKTTTAWLWRAAHDNEPAIFIIDHQRPPVHGPWARNRLQCTLQYAVGLAYTAYCSSMQPAATRPTAVSRTVVDSDSQSQAASHRPWAWGRSMFITS